LFLTSDFKFLQKYRFVFKLIHGINIKFSDSSHKERMGLRKPLRKSIGYALRATKNKGACNVLKIILSIMQNV